MPFVDAGPDLWIQFGENVTLSGNTDAPYYYWEGVQFLSCNNCLTPQITTPENTFYVLHVSDSLGCTCFRFGANQYGRYTLCPQYIYT